MEESVLYPVTLEVDYPERQSWLKTLFRFFLALPVLIFAAILAGGSFGSSDWADGRTTQFALGTVGSVSLAIWIAIVVRGYIPRWLFAFLVALIRFETRVGAYLGLLTDNYPPFEGDSPVRVEIPYPEKPSRWKVLFWKIITALPHFFILIFLALAAVFCVIVAWFAILITGRFPQGLHGFVVGVARWGLRVEAYVLSLTDEYPPFSLSGQAGSAGRDTYVVSSVIGFLLAAATIAGFITLAVVGWETTRVTVDYGDLQAGEGTTAVADDLEVFLAGAPDPSEPFPPFLPEEDKQLVAFQLVIANESDHSLRVSEDAFELKDSEGDWHDPVITVVGGLLAPVRFAGGQAYEVAVLFEIPDDAEPQELKFSTDFFERKRVVFEFE